MDDCAQTQIELGAYLVGAISPEDRARLVRHIASCERCRDELAGLAGLPGLLRRVPPDARPDRGEPGCTSEVTG